MPDTTPTPPPYRYIDQDEFCLSARLLPDLNTGAPTGTLSLTIEGSDEPQSAHVPVTDLPQVLAGIARAAGLPAPAAPADRATVLREAATAARIEGQRLAAEMSGDAGYGARAAAKVISRLADEAQPTETEAHPADTVWIAQELEGDDWVNLASGTNRDYVEGRINSYRARFPDRLTARLLRATTTYTIVQPATAATEEPQP